MEIVITNDDGWGTAGIRTLVAEMSKLGHRRSLRPIVRAAGMPLVSRSASLSISIASTMSVPPMWRSIPARVRLPIVSKCLSRSCSVISQSTCLSAVSTTATTVRSISCIRVPWVPALWRPSIRFRYRFLARRPLARSRLQPFPSLSDADRRLAPSAGFCRQPLLQCQCAYGSDTRYSMDAPMRGTLGEGTRDLYRRRGAHLLYVSGRVHQL